MDLKLSFPLKIGALVGLGVLFILGGLLLFDKRLPLLNKPAETQGKGEVFGLRAQIPAKFPRDIPLFEPATIRSTTESQRWTHVVLETERTTEEVLEYYRNGMGGLGWDAVETFKPKGGEAWVFSRDSRRLELIVVRNEEEEKTLIFLKANLP